MERRLTPGVDWKAAAPSRPAHPFGARAETGQFDFGASSQLGTRLRARLLRFDFGRPLVGDAARFLTRSLFFGERESL